MFRNPRAKLIFIVYDTLSKWAIEAGLNILGALMSDWTSFTTLLALCFAQGALSAFGLFLPL